MLSSAEMLSLAYQILTSDRLKLRRNLIKENIDIDTFFSLSFGHASRLGITKEQLTGFSDPILIAQREYNKAVDRNIKLLFPSSPDFPDSLLHTFDPPTCLYLSGKVPQWNRPSLGVVGSRKHSHYGVRIMKQYFPTLISSGLTIISGMAYGIDTIAHSLTLANRGKTVGVNAGGLLHLYPAGNSELFKMIQADGCIVSEFPLDTIPRPYHFPIRNRIIAGLSQKVWVVEAAPQSGSLITARLAIECGRDVMATPGPVDVPTSNGSNRLIRDGAKPVLSVNDILEEFGLDVVKKNGAQPMPVLEDKEARLLDLLKENGVKDIDFLVEKSALPVQLVISLLNGMLLKGIVATQPGGVWNLNE